MSNTVSVQSTRIKSYEGGPFFLRELYAAQARTTVEPGFVESNRMKGDHSS